MPFRNNRAGHFARSRERALILDTHRSGLMFDGCVDGRSPIGLSVTLTE
jgi:hypothetical protein